MKNVILNLLPFNNREDMTPIEYIIKKSLAFVLIYFAAALLGEVVVIGTMAVMGYDPLHGVMPNGTVVWASTYYGFAVFIAVTLLYCKVFEKRSIKSVLKGKAVDYLTGSLLGMAVLSVIILITCVSGSISFMGINTKIGVGTLILYLFGFIVQTGAEEIMCRGFLLGALNKRLPVWVSVLISSIAFVIPHLSSILACEPKYAVVGIVNTFLISFIFSMLVLKRGSIRIAWGMHFAWNFVLNSIMGLTVSGGESVSEGPLAFSVNEGSLLNGGVYGIEASIVTTAILGVIFIALFAILYKKGRGENGIQ